jgi:hypothetical protein
LVEGVGVADVVPEEMVSDLLDCGPDDSVT